MFGYGEIYPVEAGAEPLHVVYTISAVVTGVWRHS
jgi:hypothetical protein